MKEKIIKILEFVKYSPKTFEELSTLRIKRLEVLLQRMVWLGLLKKEESSYRITEKGALFLKEPSYFFIESFKPERVYHALYLLFVKQNQIVTTALLPIVVLKKYFNLNSLRAYALLGFLRFEKKKIKKRTYYEFYLTTQGLSFLKSYNPPLASYYVFERTI